MFEKPKPQVISGARGSAEEQDQLAKDGDAKRKAKNAVLGKVGKKDTVGFQAKYANFRIQVTNPPDLRDPMTGRVTPGRPKAAQFKEHYLFVPAKDTDTLEFLMEHPSFNKEFFKLEDLQEIQKEDERKTVVAVLEDPEQRRLIVEALKATGEPDFDLPPAKTE